MMKSDLSRSWIVMLEIFLKSVICGDNWSLVEEGKKIFSCQMALEENIYSLSFPLLHFVFKAKVGDKTTIHHYSWLLSFEFFFFLHTSQSLFTLFSLYLFYILFFLVDKYKKTIVQIYRCTKDSWNLLSGLTHRSSIKD